MGTTDVLNSRFDRVRCGILAYNVHFLIGVQMFHNKWNEVIDEV